MRIELRINGTAYPIEVEPRRTLADAIRKDCGLTGTHIGCEHGVCGACTVIVDGEPVRACLMFAVQAEGCEIRTVEGLAIRVPPPLRGGGQGEGYPTARTGDPSPQPPSPKGRGDSVSYVSSDDLHPLQSAFIAHHGLQCGFCTPGFLMLATAILERDPQASDETLIDALSANLCRCTGYQGIIDAVLDAARALRHPNAER